MRNAFLLFIFTISFSNLYGRSTGDTLKINFETFSTRNGLSQGFVCSIIQDREGFMWFATKDGLNKYDGYRVTIYRNNPQDKYSLPDNYVRQIVEDDAGNIWIGTTSKGICMFDKKMEKFHSFPPDIISGQLNNATIQVLMHRKGKLMITTGSNTLVLDISRLADEISGSVDFQKIRLLFNYNEIQKSGKYKPPGSYPNITWIDEHEIWAAFMDSLFVFKSQDNTNSWMVKSYPASVFGMSGTEDFIIPWSDNGKAIFLSSARIVVYDFISNRVVHTNTFNNNSSGLYAVKDMHNNLLIENEKQYHFDTHAYILRPLVTNPVSIRYCIGPGVIDRTGILWIGNNASTGILKYDERRGNFHSFYFANAYTYFQIQSGEILFNNNGVNSLLDYRTGKVISNYTTIPDYCYDWSFKSRDKAGNCYSSVTNLSNQGVGFIKCDLKNPTKGLMFYQDTGSCRKVFFDKDDQPWGLIERVDLSRSIVRYDHETGNKKAAYRFPISSDANEYLFISGYWQDSRDVFWFATLQGLFSFNEKKNEWHQWKNNPADSTSLSADMLFSISPDPKEPEKYLWLGTNGAGFNRFEFAAGRCIRYSEKDGLSNNVVYGILNDEAGNLWMSTNKGLSCFNTTNGSFRNFTETDGLQGDEFNRYQALKLESGELLFGGVNGITVFRPEDVLIQNPAPNIVLTGFSVFNKPVNYKNATSMMNANIGYVETITLPYDKNMFAIEFAALESAPAEKKQYKYMLEGFNKEWIDNGSKNSVSFTNLDPGEYTFHVTGTNSDGVWSKNEATVIIKVLPPWWGTWWFRLLVIAALAGMVYSIYRYRLRQAIKMHTLRNNIARDLHDEIGSTLSSISLYGESAKMMIQEDHPLNSVLSKISNSTNNMMESMSDIVWAINTRNDQFDNVINRMNAFTYQVMDAKGCNVHFETGNGSKDPELDMEQRKNLYLLYKEIISNAAKHSGCENLWVTLYSDVHSLELKVKDDGQGFNINDAGLNGMGGNGLINMKKRAHDLKATIHISSAPGKGTETELKLKL